MPLFIYKGEEPRVYVDYADGDHTLEAIPGEQYELITAPDDGLFEAVAKKVSKPVETDEN